MNWLRKLVALLAVLAFCLGCASAEAPKLTYRWLFVMRTLTDPASVQRTLDLLPRAAAAGYNGIVLSDWRLWTERAATPGHADALRKLQAEAKRNGLDLIPCVMPIGYSGRIVGEDRNARRMTPEEVRW